MTDNIDINLLFAHPDNPRSEPRSEVIDALADRMRATGFDESHAIIVRPLSAGFQIISGHHRTAAARAAGLATVPAWVREMGDDEAFMALVACNTQSELTPLERGRHALKSGLKIAEYARRVGRPDPTVRNEANAAEVAEIVHVHDLDFRVLTAVYAAPRWLWPALAERAAAEGWTVAATKGAVGGVREVTEPPSWADAAALARAIVAGEAKPGDVARMISEVTKAEASIAQGIEPDVFARTLADRMAQQKPSTVGAVMAITGAVMSEQDEAKVKADKAKRERAAADVQVREITEARIAKLKNFCTVEEWNGLGDDDKSLLLSGTFGTSSFNQTSDSVEWAWHTWNPITGCLHGCPYCYARVISLSARTASAFPNGFKPTLCASRLRAPRNTKVPAKAEQDSRYRNVFVCSMSDLFGRWVPSEWINAIISEIRQTPHWNFLCLTKFPKRMAEFDIPENMWMGTTVDLQARVQSAEAGFANVKSKVRWLSCEPMLEPLKFDRLDLFNWIVIGGASAQPATETSPATPEWFPPFEWISGIVNQARNAGVAVYFKTNLLGNRIVEMPFDAAVPKFPSVAPDVFHYLKKSAGR